MPQPSAPDRRGPAPPRPLWNGDRAVLFAVAVATFVGAMGNEFINFDDGRVLLRMSFLRSLTLEHLATCLWPLPAREEYLPLRDLSYMLTFALGDAPGWFVAGNLLLHGAVVVAIHALGLRLARAAGAPGATARRIAFTAATLFAVHPIHAESVVWISARKDSLCALFYVLAACAYIDHVRATRGRRRYGLALLAAVCALLSKASAVSLPLTLLAADGLLGHPERTWRRRALELAPFVALCGLFVVGYTGLIDAYTAASGDVVVKQHPDRAWLAIPLTDAFVLRQALTRLTLLGPPRLFAAEGYRVTLDASSVLDLAVCVAAAAGTVLLCRRSRPAGFAAAWFFLTFAPFMNLTPTGIVYAERYAHLPSIGGALVAAWGLVAGTRRLPSRTRRLVWAALVIPFVTVCLTQSAVLARAFRTGETLWSYVLRHDPTNRQATYFLANWYFGADYAHPGVEHDPARAEALYRRALELAPDRATTHRNLALLLQKTGRLDEALGHYAAARRLSPADRDALLGEGNALAEAGHLDAAVARYDEVLARWPAVGARAAFNKALALTVGGDPRARAAWQSYLTRYGASPSEAEFAARARAHLAGDGAVAPR